MSIIYNARVGLIRIGKGIPFVVCGLVLISYCEATYALYNENYFFQYDYVYLYKPISFAIARYYEYDWVSVLLMFVLGIGLETCIYNKCATLYLALHLIFKHYIENYELYPEYIYIICIINIALCGFFCYKGIKILTSRK